MEHPPTPSIPSAAAPPLRGLSRRLVRAALARLEHGRLVLHEPQGATAFGRDAEGLEAHVRIHDAAVYGAALRRGILGCGESYVDGAWDADDLVATIRLFVRNRHVMERLDRGAARISRPLLALFHRLRANTRRGSRRNIAAHYDLGNDLFALFLDETMTYSAGVFERDDATLAEASTAKYERLCRKLALEPGHHVLEIGCGWGGFALHAAQEHGCRVTAATISAEQHAWATRRVREAGLADRVEIVLCDYRDLEGRYDRVVSIEMVEAVGHAYLPRFLAVCRDRLRADGLMALQAITMPHERYDRSRRQVDFIKRYVFPGSFIPSVRAIAEAAASASDLALVDEEALGAHYARTLALWRTRFLDRRREVLDLGYDERFLRLWTYYLAYCEGGFREGALESSQLVLARPAATYAPRALGPAALAPEPAAAGAGGGWG